MTSLRRAVLALRLFHTAILELEVRTNCLIENLDLEKGAMLYTYLLVLHKRLKEFLGAVDPKKKLK